MGSWSMRVGVIFAGIVDIQSASDRRPEVSTGSDSYRLILRPPRPQPNVQSQLDRREQSRRFFVPEDGSV
jgi:hypothetical protein